MAGVTTSMSVAVLYNMMPKFGCFCVPAGMSGGIGPWCSWLTIVFQCCDTVDWVIWPVKSSPKWPIMCWVGR